MNVFNNPIHGVCQNFEKICIKTLNIWDFFIYKTAETSSEKPTEQQIVFLLTLFNIPIREFCQKFHKKCIKTLKKGNIWDFCLFRCQFEIFFISKTANSASKKPTGQRIRAMFSVFNIPIFEVYQNVNTNCIKTLKLVKVRVFCDFRCQLETFFTRETAFISS